jgi:radical SAM superfamily enzyme YgiQ (UPF0313 family)
MRILLIKPPLNRNSLIPTIGEPLELEYLASAVKDHDVEILDMRVDKKMVDKLEKFKPNLVGITAYTCEANAARIVLKEVKKFDSSIKTVVGGHHATFLPYNFAVPYVNVIFIGFSDYSFKEYIDALDGGEDVEGVGNIVMVKKDNLFFSERKQFDPNLDSLPLPARHLTRRYREHYRDTMRNKTAFILTNRGCPFRCTFCACWKLMNGRYAIRNPESVVEEMASLDDVDLICFADDNTLHDIKRAWGLVELLKRKNIEKKFTMYARADTIVNQPNLIESLKDVGLEYLTVGIESFRDDELDKLNKRSSVAVNNEAIRVLQRIGVSISAHLIVDPDFDKDDFKHLYQHICRMDLFRLAFAVLTPLPGTELYLRNYDRFIIRDYDYFDFAHSIFPTKLSRKEFYSELAGLYRKSYSLQRYFQSMLKDFLFSLRKPEGNQNCRKDRLSFLKIMLLNIFGYPLYLRLKHSHKSEPIFHPGMNE